MSGVDLFDYVDGLYDEADRPEREQALNDENLRDEERGRCRAELMKKITELNDTCKTDRVWIGGLIRWAREEAFGGE